MSLGKVKTTLKTGVGELQSTAGLKRVAMHTGIGFAIGAIVFLIIRAIFIHLIYSKNGLGWLEVHPDHPELPAGPPMIWGVSIFPDGRDLMYDEVLLIIITLVTLVSKKLWFTIGFFLGWYTSDYLGLYSALGIPVPEQ